MDAKVTLSFDKNIIEKAKKFAADNRISLSRLTEYLYDQMTSKSYSTLEDLPISDWINEVAEGEITYTKTSSRKRLKSDYFDSKK